MNIEYPCSGRNRHLLVSLALLWYAASAMGQDVWTLETSIERVLEVAPESLAAEATIRGQQGALKQAGAWPNPEIELRGDNEIEQDEGSSGASFTQFRFSQPLPVSGRLKHQKAVARAELSGAKSERQYQLLLLETQAAERFHVLQFRIAALDLAERRLRLADELQSAGRRREEAGELAKLERLRLDIIRETAKQIIDQAEGEYNEALSQFRAYLGLAVTPVPKLAPLVPSGPVPSLESVQSGLAAHPALMAMRDRVNAARSQVKLVRSERIPDPELNLFRERGFLNDRRQDVTGIGISIGLPIWDRKRGHLIQARARVDQTQFELQALERDLASQLQQSHLHLGHLVKQGEHYRTHVFEPALIVFDLTRKAYTAGEVEILSLIDANDTYFNAYERYLELLQEAWLEAAELRFAAGQPLVPTVQDN